MEKNASGKLKAVVPSFGHRCAVEKGLGVPPQNDCLRRWIQMECLQPCFWEEENPEGGGGNRTTCSLREAYQSSRGKLFALMWAASNKPSLQKQSCQLFEKLWHPWARYTISKVYYKQYRKWYYRNERYCSKNDTCSNSCRSLSPYSIVKASSLIA